MKETKGGNGMKRMKTIWELWWQQINPARHGPDTCHTHTHTHTHTLTHTLSLTNSQNTQVCITSNLLYHSLHHPLHQSHDDNPSSHDTRWAHTAWPDHNDKRCTPWVGPGSRPGSSDILCQVLCASAADPWQLERCPSVPITRRKEDIRKDENSCQEKGRWTESLNDFLFFYMRVS